MSRRHLDSDLRYYVNNVKSGRFKNKNPNGIVSFSVWPFAFYFST